MRIKNYTFNVEKCGPIMNLYNMPDCHFGSPAFLEHEYERLATIIENDPLAYLIFQGDLIDSNRPSTRELKKIAYSARREEQEQEDDRNSFWIENKIVPKLKRIIKKGRCLGMLDGDHYMLNESGISTTQTICVRMGLPYLGDGQAIIRLHFRHRGGEKVIGTVRTLTIHVQHGIGGGGRAGTSVNRIDDMCNIWDGVDVFLRGHSHRGFIYPVAKYFVPQRLDKIEQRDIWLVNTPSFRTGIVMGKTDYAESRNYGATAYKYPVLHISGGKLQKNNSNYRLNITGELL